MAEDKEVVCPYCEKMYHRSEHSLENQNQKLCPLCLKVQVQLMTGTNAAKSTVAGLNARILHFKKEISLTMFDKGLFDGKAMKATDPDVKALWLTRSKNATARVEYLKKHIKEIEADIVDVKKGRQSNIVKKAREVQRAQRSDNIDSSIGRVSAANELPAENEQSDIP